MLYFTSDLHLSHDKDFLYEPRGFENITQHNITVIENINSIVGENDDLYILGDVILKDNTIGFWFFKQIKCKHIHIILGNHDTKNKIELYKTFENVVEIEYALPFKYGKYYFFLSHYPSLVGNFDDGEKLKEQRINLCAHNHTQNRFKDLNKGLIYHVELDAHNNFPVSIEEIISDLKYFISLDKDKQKEIMEKKKYEKN